MTPSSNANRGSLHRILGESFLLIAFATALYLTAWRPSILAGRAGCVLKSGCDVVISSGLSMISSIPISVIGMVVAGSLLVASTIGLLGVSRVARFAFTILISSTLLVSIALQGYSILTLHAFCPFCFGFLICIFGAFACLVPRISSFPQERKPAEFLPYILIGFFCSLVFLLLPQVGTDDPKIDLIAVKKLYEAKQIPERILRVNQDERRKVLVFANLSCGHCQQFIPDLIRNVSGKSSIELDFYWFIAYPGDVEFVTLGKLASARCRQSDILIALFTAQGKTFTRESEFRKKLGLKVTDLERDLATRRSTERIIDAQRNFIEKVRLSETPCYVSLDDRNGPSLVSEDWILRLAAVPTRGQVATTP